MELILDMVGSEQFISGMPVSKTFRQAGGIIGRAEDCDWVIPDRKRVVSGRHAQVSFENGAFYLTDTSSNGILLKPGNTPLPKGQPQRIEHGTLYSLGDFDIRARVVQDPAVFSEDLGRPQDAGSIIPDDAFLDLDPLHALDQQEEMYAAGDDLATFSLPPSAEPAQAPDYAPINMENLTIPELVAAPPPVQAAPQTAPALAAQPELFWQQFAEALGISLDELDETQRQALAVKAARLLKQQVGSLQQSLRNRNELKSEMKLAVTSVEQVSNNPLKFSSDSRQALGSLLRPSATDMPAEQAINRAFRDLQAHQVALIAASRAAIKSILEHLSPDQLTLRFERENKSLMNTAGSRWRAYTHLYQALQRDDNWSQRLYARDFVVAYEEQIRLIATLNTDHQG
ncbi:type VI secretion system-associated FHA domain protein TagH [Halopseudomonas pelagia]|uniref:type VI secretion system-associated FHA domain protein TagH n=1 Tax=Halopseudomonas pelagia TaxID=553151 RepID=UPI0003AA18AB|nr:type VI secretion system-associated FHA domain protein TagH [Halopseudomonas pelagia]|tara:strand:- start:952 stop:2151 length:1200 start_codon:yes stop_codon:yes gene_type:complete